MKNEDEIVEEKTYTTIKGNVCQTKKMYSHTENRIKEYVVDRRYNRYCHWRDLFSRGQITREQVRYILEGDGMISFYDEKDFVLGYEGVSTEESDRRYNNTKLREQTWGAVLAMRTKNPVAFKNMLGDYIATIFDKRVKKDEK